MEDFALSQKEEKDFATLKQVQIKVDEVTKQQMLAAIKVRANEESEDSIWKKISVLLVQPFSLLAVGLTGLALFFLPTLSQRGSPPFFASNSPDRLVISMQPQGRGAGATMNQKYMGGGGGGSLETTDTMLVDPNFPVIKTLFEYTYSGDSNQLALRTDEPIAKIVFKDSNETEFSALAEKLGFSATDRLDVCVADPVTLPLPLQGMVGINVKRPLEEPISTDGVEIQEKKLIAPEIDENRCKQFIAYRKEGKYLFTDIEYGQGYFTYREVPGGDIQKEFFAIAQEQFAELPTTPQFDGKEELVKSFVLSNGFVGADLEGKLNITPAQDVWYACPKGEYPYLNPESDAARNMQPMQPPVPPDTCAKEQSFIAQESSVDIPAKPYVMPTVEVTTNKPKAFMRQYFVGVQQDKEQKLYGSIMTVAVNSQGNVVEINGRLLANVQTFNLASSDANTILEKLKQGEIEPINNYQLFAARSGEGPTDGAKKEEVTITHKFTGQEVGTATEVIWATDGSIYLVPSYHFKGKILYGEHPEDVKARQDQTKKERCEVLQKEIQKNNDIAVEPNDLVKYSEIEKLYNEFNELRCHVFEPWYSDNLKEQDYEFSVPAFLGLTLEKGGL